jgi:hypothetical protein
VRQYDQILSRIREIENVITSSGRSSANTRLARYKKAFEILADPVKLQRLTELFTKEERIQLFATMGELYELNRIFDVLGPKYPELLLPKVRDLLSGPDAAGGEVSTGGKSSHARNIQFELFVMAEFSAAGFSISDNSLTDVRSIHNGQAVLVECKRPQRDSSVHGSLKDALRQLNGQPRNQVPGALKIVALSLTKVLTDEVGIVGTPTGAHAGEFVRSWIEKAIDPHLKYVQRNGGANLGGVLAYAAMSAIQADTGNPATVMMQVFFDNPAADTDTLASAKSWFHAFSSSEHPGVTMLPSARESIVSKAKPFEPKFMDPRPSESESLNLVRDILAATRTSLDSLRGKAVPLSTAKYLLFSAQHVIELTTAYVALRDLGQKYASCQLIRSALEGMYRFEAVLKKPSVLYRIAFSEHQEDKKLLKAFKKTPSFEEYAKQSDLNWENVSQAFRGAFSGEPLNDHPISIWELAVIAERSSDYECFYRYYSQFAHGALRATGQTFTDFAYFDSPTLANVCFVILEGLRSLGASLPDISLLHQRFNGFYSDIGSGAAAEQ